jgi:hypothetical protein
MISDSRKGSTFSRGIIIAIAAGSTFLVLCLIGLIVYAILQKKRAEKAIGISRPFGNQTKFSLLFQKKSFILIFLYHKHLFFQHHGHQVVRIVEVHHNWREQDGSLTMNSKSAPTISLEAMNSALVAMARYFLYVNIPLVQKMFSSWLSVSYYTCQSYLNSILN